MADEQEAIDISQNPELVRLVEEIRRSNTARVLRRGDEDVAIMLPVTNAFRRKHKRVKTDAEYEAFLASAGSWADVDVDAFNRYLHERRGASSRPPVEL